MNKKIILIIFFFIAFFENSFPQNFKSIFIELDCKDKFWIMTKPFSAIKVRKISNQVMKISNKKMKDNYLDADGERVDAFRHILLLYKLSSDIGIKKARRFGNIYEDYNKKIFLKTHNSGYDKRGGEMDKFNNELGIFLYLKLGLVQDDILFEEIDYQIKKGNARIIKKDREGKSLDIDNKIIEDSIWIKNWENNRVLIQSNK